MTRRAGVIGHPIAHSLSPVFQSAAFRHCGLDATYEAWDTPPADLPARLLSLRGEGYLGANVTIPHKQAVIPLLDELGGQSAKVGAVNTIVNRAGRLFGFNTDGPGFVTAVRNEAHHDPAGRTVLLVGAGGAARGIAFTLADARAARIDIANRTQATADALARDLVHDGAASRAIALSQPIDQYDCIVNCTSVGMAGTGTEDESPVSVEHLKPGALVVDIVYRPEETPLLRNASAAGHPTLGGLPMLIYQGALSFELFAGVPAPVDVMFEAARGALRGAPS